jgi:cell division transport system ATP-binding protein
LGYPTKEITERVEECIDLVKLEGKEKLKPSQLSGGEQQRASLARAIVKDPSVLLADEPTGNLDPVSAFELVKLLQEIHETGTTILMASHNYSLIKGRGYRILELQNGHLRGNG